MAEQIIVPDSLATLGSGGPDEEVIRAAMNRIGSHDPARLNAVAHAVTDVLGFTLFSRRYAIAVLVLEALDQTSASARPSGDPAVSKSGAYNSLTPNGAAPGEVDG